MRQSYLYLKVLALYMAVLHPLAAYSHSFSNGIEIKKHGKDTAYVDNTIIHISAHAQSSDNKPLNGASAIILTATDPEITTRTSSDGLVDINLTAGSGFAIVVEQNNYLGLYAGLAIKGKEKPTIICKDEKNQIAVIVIVEADKKPTHQAQFTVTDGRTNSIIKAYYHEGILAFMGERDVHYKIDYKDNNLPQIKREVAIGMNSQTYEKIIIDLIDDTKVPVIGSLHDENGDLLKEARVSIIERSTNKPIVCQFKNGMMSFQGRPGEKYIINIMQNNKPISTQEINVYDRNEELFISTTTNAPKDVETSSAILDDTSPGMTIQLDAKSETGIVLDHVDYIITEKLSNRIIPFQRKAETATFEGKVGREYSIKAYHAGYHIASRDIKMPSKPTSTIRLLFKMEVKNSFPVIGTIKNIENEFLKDASVTVTDKLTNEVLPVQYHGGILSFTGEEESEYYIRANLEGYESYSKDITIPRKLESIVEIALVLNRIPKPVSLVQLNLQTLTAEDSIGIPNAMVKVITMITPDQEYITDNTGTIFFDLPEQTPFVLISKKENYVGLISGVSKMINKSSPMKIIANLDTTTPIVIGLITNEQGTIIKNATISIVEISTGQRITFEQNFALFSFLTQKGQRYSIDVNADGYLPRKEEISTNAGGERRISIKLISELKGQSENIKRSKQQESYTFTYPDKQEINSSSKRKENSANKTEVEREADYNGVIQKYGTKQLPGLLFQVAVGAYRNSHDLTFTELSDLGTLEKIHKDGITYYYIGTYSTLKKMEEVRQEVIRRGVKDASYKITYNGKRVDLSGFVSLTN